ncbi:major vault protein [Myotis myotis]|uniref:Major vault protein n=2 Tax=Myotis myotis TaxID=51298 RepID=A0A7J7Y1L7_MYOMY|nr:major vault protein [Myotis myotis]XP_036164589.1 major vault protein [Myotis myotis]XP_036164590.1 major vault protein [Myotis myotis]XP_036164591.1 major vault protein [Myotis myotis]XP_036164592.1 major vault protein [Myotis myotis]XP_036164593.1 major vault protein [Myotis myotis]KAF6355546.1 major vault protein [Myotis myotis]
MATEESIIRIPPYHYIHVLDQNSNVSRVVVGPKTYIRQDNERVLFAPLCMVTVPPRHYCTVANPVSRDAQGSVLFDVTGQVRLRHADLEIRLAQDPFPLYPGEVLEKDITPLQVVLPNTALHLKALLDFEDENGDKVVAGDEWLFEGPGTYIPQKEVEVVEIIQATIIRQNQALRLRARKECRDRDGKERVTGEEWLVRSVGAYLPAVFEEVLDLVDAVILTEKTALHLRALQNFRDSRGVARRTGEEWLVTVQDTEAHVPDVYEEVLGVVPITTLGPRNYCVILDPVGQDGKNQLGQKLVVKGEKSFFLQPGERLERGIQDVYVLSEQQGLLLRALQPLEEGEGEEKVSHKAGDHWLIRGPLEYVPSAMVEVVEERQAIPLDQNEGIYVQDIKTGRVRAVIGSTYMLTEDEVLWEKELPPGVEELLNKGQDPLADRGKEVTKALPSAPRNKTRVVSYRVPHNAAVQVYDYREKRARVVFGPELVSLGPEEQFTVLSLSAGRPKRPHARRALCLLLGPDFFTDVITIETADHARLQLQLAYNWHFELSDRKDPQEAAKLFSVPDFVGDACKAIASRVRGAVASVTFDDFHKNSARIIRTAVFGFETLEPKGTDAETLLQPRDRAVFPQNGLVISSVDVQSVEPVDQRTRDALQRSVQLAIEITTNSQEAAAKHEAQRLEQEARGRLERQKILDQSEAEKARRELLELEALSTAVESTGTAKAEAESRAEAARIEGHGSVLQAKLKAEALAIETEAELQRVKKVRELELAYARSQLELEVSKAQQLAEVEVKKFKQMTEALGPSTIRDLAIAGPEMQVKLLQSLGLKSTLITDGSTPINLFSTALGLLGLGSEAQPSAKKAAGGPGPEEHLLLHSSQVLGSKDTVP